jgi:Flp pilus assembly protein TadG
MHISKKISPSLKILRNLKADQGGLAIVEFAFALPILLSLFLSGLQLCDAIATNRKVTITARAMSDLASQYSSVSDADLDLVLNASAQVMTPYTTDNLALTISQVTVDAAGTPKISWSRGLNATPLAIGTTITLPTSIAVPNTSYIISNVNYSYVPQWGAFLVGTLDLSDQILMSPRATTTITKK